VNPQAPVTRAGRLASALHDRSRRAQGPEHVHAVGLAAVLVSVLMLSGGSTLVKEAGEPGPIVAFWRLAFATVVWQAFLFARGTPLDRRTWKLAAPGGILFGLDLVLFFSAVRATRVANAEFIGTLTPVLVVPIAALALGERVRLRTIALGAVAMSGVAVILFNAPSDGTDSNLRGDLLAVFAVLTWASFFLVAKRARATIDTARFMGGMTTVAAVVVLPFAVGTGGMFSLSAKAWVLCAVLALVTGTMAHGLLVWAQGHVPVSTSSMLTLAQPGFAVMWAWLVLEESVRPIQMAGMAAVLAALGVITLSAARA
jgi:drug/metabolite transporter (DMT)-like permease